MSIERGKADLERARGEVIRLAAQLRAAESRVVKIEHYLEMARGYEVPDSDDITRSRSAGPPLVQATIDIIRERGSRQPTRLLVEELERRGHHIGGANKITNLSGTLSRSPNLSASRVEGWGLKEWERGQDQSTVTGGSSEEDGLGEFVPPADIPDSPPSPHEEDDFPF